MTEDLKHFLTIQSNFYVVNSAAAHCLVPCCLELSGCTAKVRISFVLKELLCSPHEG